MRGRVVPLRAGNESGTAAAEFAVTLPAVLLVLALCIGGVQASALHVRLQDAAADAARATARGAAPPGGGARRPAPAPPGRRGPP
ncbi:MAG: TadE family type IV pilus minor pilin, partial [Pseudoclavibacter sp.]|nr:TadE family type IV pilus minor pilin [Pseudoclavibacter sp.]